jgi:hypothetical protein
MPLYKFIQNFLNVLVQIANKMGLQKKKLNIRHKNGFVNILNCSVSNLVTSRLSTAEVME